MSRYFAENDGVATEVYSITKNETNDAIKDRNYVMKQKRKEFKRSRDELFYSKRKNKKGNDKFPGRAPIKAESLEKHQYIYCPLIAIIRLKSAPKGDS